MKKFLFILILATTLFAGSYCDGWRDGYIAGYCYNKSYGCIAPIVPICPIPKMGESTYQNGYNRAFLAGLAASN